jgi:ribosome-associated toxin RatA of RatAB toxin-antitoxin module
MTMRTWLGYVIALVLLAAAGSPVAARSVENDSIIQVSEDQGIYRISAEFCVPQPSTLVFAVLSDYDDIPRFMPDVTSSRVIERSDGHVLVEQEALAKLMFFSKRIELRLDITETAGSIHFRDESGKSFSRYEGGWRIHQRDTRTVITYEVIARPAFDVPEFILKRLLKRNATRMIENLRTEMVARATTPLSPKS